MSRFIFVKGGGCPECCLDGDERGCSSPLRPNCGHGHLELNTAKPASVRVREVPADGELCGVPFVYVTTLKTIADELEQEERRNP